MNGAGRLAPSPTGAQHLGNARTYLIAWLAARSQGDHLWLRIEDLDSPRVKPGAVGQIFEDLAWLGLTWDLFPKGRSTTGGVIYQTERVARYREILELLKQQGLVYPCRCTRKDVEQAASAPHLTHEGVVYPGTCAHYSVDAAERWNPTTYCWRFSWARLAQHLAATDVSSDSYTSTQPLGNTWRSPDAVVAYYDLCAGWQHRRPGTELGDFVVAKGTGQPSYQLAVVTDDHDMGVTTVVRGDDLIPSTFRQLALYSALNWKPPQFAHVPMVVGTDGRRLAKRHGDTRLSLLREQQCTSQKVIGFLAWSCGVIPTWEPITPAALIPHFSWTRLHQHRFVLTPEHWQQLLLPNHPPRTP